MSDLKDLIEFRYDREKRVFVKVQTHLYNKSDSLCYGMKLRIEAHGVSLLTRFKVVSNGLLQYSNLFKKKDYEQIEQAILRRQQALEGAAV